MWFRSKNKSYNFDEEYKKAIKELKIALTDAERISKLVEKKLNEDDFEDLIKLLDELMPKAICNLSRVYDFVHKYHGAPFVYKNENTNLEDIKNDFFPEETE